MTTVEVSDRAAEWLDDADPQVSDRITSKLADLKDFPEHYLTRLSGSEYYRLRVGEYRCVIDWQRENDRLLVRRIGHRRNVYD